MSIYLKIDGIKGNVTSRGHEEWINIDSIQWRVVRAVSTLTSANSNWATSKTGISEIAVTKIMDESSPLIFNEACIGESKKTQIHLSTDNNGKKGTYMEYDLEDCMVSSYSVSSEGEIPKESISFTFTRMSMKFIPYDKSGKPQEPILAGYDITKGTKI